MHPFSSLTLNNPAVIIFILTLLSVEYLLKARTVKSAETAGNCCDRSNGCTRNNTRTVQSIPRLYNEDQLLLLVSSEIVSGSADRQSEKGGPRP
jgi:hypothetical protein